MTLKIYKISQRRKDHNCLRSAIVVAEDMLTARSTHPKGLRWLSLNQEWWFQEEGFTKRDKSWDTPENIQVDELGIVTSSLLKSGDILSVDYYD